MLYRKSLRLLLAVALVSSVAVARQKVARHVVPDVERLREHINYLASDKLEGRRTGAPGALEAARYVAEEFRRLGLAPGVENSITFQSGPSRIGGGYFQMFPYVAGVELGKSNEMTLTARTADGSPTGTLATLDLRVGEDWMPLGFSASSKVESASVVFVGYGITDAEQNYDDYKGADVKDHIALALSGTPDDDNPHGRFTRAGELRFKAAAARAAGAKALVIVAREENFKDDKLTALKYDNAGGDAGLPVVVISRQVATKILGLSGSAQLKAVEESYPKWYSEANADRGENRLQPYVFDLEHLKLSALSNSLGITTDIVRKNAPAANVVGVLEGSDPKLKGETIVIGAHYDHLGRGGQGSLAPREGEIHHGADDNASGVAGLLELARLFSQEREMMRRTVVFIAFGGEEEGLIGSSYYVANPARPLEQTVAMINMDMVGRLRDDALTVGGVGTASEWRGWVEKANKGYKVSVEPAASGARSHPNATGDGAARKQDSSRRDAARSQDVLKQAQAKGAQKPDGAVVITGTDGRTVATAVPGALFALRLNEDGYGPSDHSSFYSKRVPVLFFFTGAHENYHKPSDTADKINYEGEARVPSPSRKRTRARRASASTSEPFPLTQTLRTDSSSTACAKALRRRRQG
ncbi:MAG: hypothetical protein DMF65_12735 [Acidobacteria bacterium]|nr:MAG: hypothetical protein DMF65_12735 [Acidobacteriota bacterium]